MNKTPIEWVRNPDGTPGYSWNPITGCLNGCSYCYARKLANTRLKERYRNNLDIFDDGLEAEEFDRRVDDPFYPRFWGNRLHQPATGNRFKGVFTCDMSDLFGIGIPEEWTRSVLKEITLNPYSRFYLLTKQPQNLAKFSPFPDNCWVGVTATDFSSFNKAIAHLLGIEAKVKYLSFEPLLEKVMGDATDATTYVASILNRSGIKQLIIGGQTKPTVYPKIEWVREIVEAADKAGIPVFLKDSLVNFLPIEPLFFKPVGDGDCYQLRQGFPKT